MIVLTLPYPISANRYWATRVLQVRATGKHMAITYVTKEAEQYKRDVAMMVKAAGITKPIHGRVRVTIALYPERPKDWARRARINPDGWDDDVRCIDLDNCEKVLFDALKGIAFGDDSWLWDIHAKRMEPDANGARVVVSIEPIESKKAQGSLLEVA